MLLQIFLVVKYITNANSQGAGNILEFLTHKYSYPIGGRIYVYLTLNFVTFKVEKILKNSLDSIPSPSPSVKIQIFGGRVNLTQ